jgi:hypothetical protein
VVGVVAAFLTFSRSSVSSAADAASENRPRFLGANSCSTSGCHGGGGAHQNQYLVWSTRDFHFQRPYATLTTARSKQISAALQIKDATTAEQCAACHAPMRAVAETLRGESLRISEGVSCETCHGPAENWLRSHTRADFTHGDRTFAGMRDLKNLYVRANTCVACHQNVSPPLMDAGHPELIFELDGQAVTEPKHWREKEDWDGAQAWAVGQAVALREMLWQLQSNDKENAKLIARTEALLWLFGKLDSIGEEFFKSGLATGQSGKDKLSQSRASADTLARDLAGITWTADKTRSILKTLSNSGADFKKPSAFPEQHARRAERLALALDRLSKSKPGSKSETHLQKIFSLVQSIPDFDSAAFAAALDAFSQSL